MPKFAANLSMLFTELPFLERFKAAADAGFGSVEFMFPYDVAAAEITAQLRWHRLVPVLFNLPPGNWAAGERGLACLPNRVKEFRDGVMQARRYAKAIGCPRLHCLAGIVPEGADPHVLRDTYVENLRFAADAVRDDGMTVLIEPINTRDIPAYFLTGTKQALKVIKDVSVENLKLQYDCYHMHIMEGDVAAAIARNLDIIGHIQIADAPGRHEPGTGEIDYPALFQHLDAIGYAGFIGCEYKPQATTPGSLAWFERYARRG
jgi:hydroxypyruvate isomerase